MLSGRGLDNFWTWLFKSVDAVGGQPNQNRTYENSQEH